MDKDACAEAYKSWCSAGNPNYTAPELVFRAGYDAGQKDQNLWHSLIMQRLKTIEDSVAKVADKSGEPDDSTWCLKYLCEAIYHWEEYGKCKKKTTKIQDET